MPSEKTCYRSLEELRADIGFTNGKGTTLRYSVRSAHDFLGIRHHIGHFSTYPSEIDSAKLIFTELVGNALEASDNGSARGIYIEGERGVVVGAENSGEFLTEEQIEEFLREGQLPSTKAEEVGERGRGLFLTYLFCSGFYIGDGKFYAVISQD